MTVNHSVRGSSPRKPAKHQEDAMKKPTSNYRMTRAAKTYLAFNWNRPNRRARKQTVIEGELYGAEVFKSKTRKESSGQPASDL